MDLLELDSNKYRAILKLKRRIAEHPDSSLGKIMAGEEDSCDRAIDEFGELAVKRLTQPSHIEFNPDGIAAIILRAYPQIDKGAQRKKLHQIKEMRSPD